VLSFLVFLPGCDAFMTEAPPAGDVMDSALEGLPPDLAATFAAGDENFDETFAAATGLGPIFNHVACAGCHPGDGRGSPAEALVRFSRGADLAHGEGGPQLQDKSIPGVRAESLPPGVDRSVRLPPPVFGVGLIESIPVETILANEDPADADADGISGRAHWVTAADYVPGYERGGGAGPQLGRFSRKAQVSSLLQQIVEAYREDIGITSDYVPSESPHPQGDPAVGDGVADPELTTATVLETVTYVRLLAPPAPGAPTAQTEHGRTLFDAARCTACHVASMRTGPNPVAALADVEVPLFSDLLLHDMGPDLADHRVDGDASGSEWRTAPLWGLRVAAEFLGGETFFLHDGRTTDLHTAITLHGGESAASRDAYLALSAEDQAALRAFVMSR
jgi:CxxC motif-containing protein (DUF1111 family)